MKTRDNLLTVESASIESVFLRYDDGEISTSDLYDELSTREGPNSRSELIHALRQVLDTLRDALSDEPREACAPEPTHAHRD